MVVRGCGKLVTPWLAIALVCALQAQERVSEVAPASDSIHADELKSDLTFFASDRLEGRLTGTRGNQLATEFIGRRFDELGLKPMGAKGSYFQSYELLTAKLGTSNDIQAQVNGQSVRANVSDDFYPHRFSASTRASGGLVFAGFGIVAPERGYDDYREADVRGRVVLVLDHGPGERDQSSVLDGIVSTEAATPLRKTLAAQANGAAAVLIVSDVHNHTNGSFAAEAAGVWPRTAPRIERYTLAQWIERVRIPAMQISPELATDLLRPVGKSLSELARASESAAGRTPISISATQVEVGGAVERRLVSDRNVVAALEGSDPRLRDEWIIVCAHLDHEGIDGASVFSGADDNGSGVVGMLEIAEAYVEAARAGRRPRRSVLFAAWNSEERGLLGAWAYTERPVVPLERTVAVLNMDMIGRSEEVPANAGARFQGLEPQSAESNENTVHLLGYSYTPELSEEVTRANTAVGLELKRRYDNTSANLIRRSDQWPFLQRGVPALWFFTGLHPDYHTQADRPEKINYAKMTRVVRLVHQTSWLVAQRDGRPKLEMKPGSNLR